VSEYRYSGPLANQTSTTSNAARKAHGEPTM
jgi:hypothetical protein